MNKKKVLIITSIFVVVVLLALGTSYALFRINITKNTDFKLKAGNLVLSINDNSNTFTDGKLIINNMVPTSESTALSQTGYNFTLTNTGTIDANYKIYLDDATVSGSTRLSDDLIKVNITNTTLNQSRTVSLNELTNRIIDTGTIKKNTSYNYVLRVWLDYNAGNEAANKYFGLKLRIDGTQANEKEFTYTDPILNGADPVLTDNLIPVTIDNTGVVRKADTTKEWYSYENKKWANSVVLKDGTINSYDKLNSQGKVSGATKENGYVSLTDSDYIDLGLNNYDYGDSFTLSVKVKFNALGTQEFLYTKKNKAGIVLKLADGYFRIGGYNSSEKPIGLTSTVLANTTDTYVFTAVYNNLNVILYLNGEKIDEKNIGSSYEYNSNSSMKLARCDAYKVAIYDRALSADEIQQNFKDDINIIDDTDLLVYEDFTDHEPTNNETILEDEIESYFVWIPKYSYKLFDMGNYNSATQSDEIPANFKSKAQPIDIKFGLENTTDTASTCAPPINQAGTQALAGESGNCSVGKYMTHPAFITMDSNGLWVGKFETGYGGNGSVYDETQIVVKPNVYSWRSMTVGNMFKNSYNYMREEDSHMMKNTEWGAMAYLSHSIYGTCTGKKCSEVRINNNSNYVTGFAAVEVPTETYALGTSIEGNRVEAVNPNTNGTYSINYLNTNSQTASTTLNYTGIYDTSGGTHEYFMGYSTNATNDQSNITTLYNDFYNDITYSKYWDKYLSTGVQNYNNRILGDATGELGPFILTKDKDNNYRNKSSWYFDYANFVNPNNPWFSRGNIWFYGIESGIFTFCNHYGSVASNITYRIVLAPKEN